MHTTGAPRRWRARALGLSVAVAADLPSVCHAALSIPSGYETFLMGIRRRIVCEEGDVFDEAEQRGRMQPCDSMKEGPFCRGLAEAGPQTSMRHRPSTIDSIVPQHLFGDPRAAVEMGQSQQNVEEVPETVTNKQATQTLNQFLEEFYDPNKALRKTSPVEGRLEFGHVPWSRSSGLPPGYSRGLPEGVLATWDGAWQVVPNPSPHPAVGSGAVPRSGAVARLNGALGTLHFSRPVVVRQLLVRPPQHAIAGLHQLHIRGRKDGKESWRSAYHFNATGDFEPQLSCSVGDLVTARWAHDGRYYMAVILMTFKSSVLVRWLDNDHTHRLIAWKYVYGADGTLCVPRQETGRGVLELQPPWRDLARRMKAVDEIAFLVPQGTEGWILAEVEVAAIRWSPEADELGSKSVKDAFIPMVQVYPGPRAVIVHASSAAVMYHADDMLERGLQLRMARSLKDIDEVVTAHDTDTASPGDADDGQGYVTLSTSASVEGLRQLLRALGDWGSGSAVRLPPHLRPDQFLQNVEQLIQNLDPDRAEANTVKQYGHFEALFGHHWDWVTPTDALEVAYDRWRRDPVAQAEANDSFYAGQLWNGSYFCTQGPTKLGLEVTSVSQVDGQMSVRADLAFTIITKKKSVLGRYEVSGRLQPAGRVLLFEPIAGSWKDKPANFVMVGLHGVVSRTPRPGELRFAGSVPIFGCDSFELTSMLQGATGNEQGEASPATIPPKSTLWSHTLLRYSQAIEDVRHRWRRQLTKLINSGQGKKGNSTAAPPNVAQLLQAAKNAGAEMNMNGDAYTFAVTTESGQEIAVRFEPGR